MNEPQDLVSYEDKVYSKPEGQHLYTPVPMSKPNREQRRNTNRVMKRKAKRPNKDGNRR